MKVRRNKFDLDDHLDSLFEEVFPKDAAAEHVSGRAVKALIWYLSDVPFQKVSTGEPWQLTNRSARHSQPEQRTGQRG